VAQNRQNHNTRPARDFVSPHTSRENLSRQHFSNNPLERVEAAAGIRSFAEAVTFLAGRAEAPLTADLDVVVRSRGRGDKPIAIALRFRDWYDILVYFNDETFNFQDHRSAQTNWIARLNQFGPRGWFFAREDGILCGNHYRADQKRRRPIFPESDQAPDHDK
jgi:hypothetical protein